MKKILTILIGLVVLGAVVFGAMKYGKKAGVVSDMATTTSGVMEDGSSTDEATEPIPEVVPGVVEKVNATTNTFTHKGYGFTLNYPSGMTTSNFREGSGEQIVFQNTKNGDWFQVYVTPWDETGDITATRIKQDLPDLLISSPQKAIIGPQQKQGIGPHALIFLSNEKGLGDTREVWFVANGNLYQVTTYKRLDAMLGQVLSTLTFK